jgi:hypothetical protein
MFNKTGHPVELIAILIFLNSGCATNPKIPSCAGALPQPTAVTAQLDEYSSNSVVKETEKLLGTRLDYHLLAADASAAVAAVEGATRHKKLMLNVPVFVLGIEKPREKTPAHFEGEKKCLGRDFSLDALRNSSPKSYKTACQVMNDPRPLLLTHIVEFQAGIQSGVLSKPCYHFNVYQSGERCPQIEPTEVMSKTRGYDYSMAVDSINSLKSRIDEVLAKEKISHVFLMSTGWNTQQDESLYNYLDWVDVISKAAGKPFNPLVVAITWESGWDRFFRPAGVVTKGNDADEIGLTWVNRLLHDVLVPASAKSSTPLVLIGHSYGTRVLGTALFRPDVIKPLVPRTQHPPLAFIALQPAFPIQRFDNDLGAEPLFFAEQRPAASVVMTASVHDSANGKIKGRGMYAGGSSAIKWVSNGNNRFDFATADDQGHVSLPKVAPKQSGVLIDASAMVNCQMPQTGGDAHSDVFDLAAGQLIWDVISQTQKHSD